MYDWVEAVTFQLKSCFYEFAHPMREATRFERDAFEFFCKYRRFDYARYIVVLSRQRYYHDRPYTFFGLTIDQDPTIALDRYKKDGYEAHALFRTDTPLSEQWPCDEPGCIHHPSQFETPAFNPHWEDRHLSPLKATTEDGHIYTPPPYFKGVILGGNI